MTKEFHLTNLTLTNTTTIIIWRINKGRLWPYEELIKIEYERCNQHPEYNLNILSQTYQNLDRLNSKPANKKNNLHCSTLENWQLFSLGNLDNK